MPARIAKSAKPPSVSVRPPPRRAQPSAELIRRSNPSAQPSLTIHTLTGPSGGGVLFGGFWKLTEDVGEFPRLLLDAAACDTFAAAGLAGVAVDGPEREAAHPRLLFGKIPQGSGVVQREDFLFHIVLPNHGTKPNLNC